MQKYYRNRIIQKGSLTNCNYNFLGFVGHSWKPEPKLFKELQGNILAMGAVSEAYSEN